jgi:hypothetical protein
MPFRNAGVPAGSFDFRFSKTVNHAVVVGRGFSRDINPAQHRGFSP